MIWKLSKLSYEHLLPFLKSFKLLLVTQKFLSFVDNLHIIWQLILWPLIWYQDNTFIATSEKLGSFWYTIMSRTCPIWKFHATETNFGTYFKWLYNSAVNFYLICIKLAYQGSNRPKNTQTDSTLIRITFQRNKGSNKWYHGCRCYTKL